MEVAQVCTTFLSHYGGVATHVEEISKRLTKLGVNVKIFTTDPVGKLPKREIANDLEIYRFRSIPLETYFLAPRLYSALKKVKKTEIIHAHNYQAFPALAATLAKGKNKKPLVLTPHFHPIAKSAWWTLAKLIYNVSIGRRMFKRADAVVAVSKYEKRFLEEKFGLNEDRVVYIPNGIDEEKFRGLTRKRRSKAVLYVGRLEKYKGVHHLIRTFLKVKAIVPDSRLLIVGTGPYKRRLLSLAEHLGVKDVFFLENIPKKELMDLYQSSGVFVMPSKYEAFCIALVEAMACGLPVVATRVGGLSELVRHGENGFSMDHPPAEEELAELITLLLEDEELSMKMGLNAKSYVVKRFSWNRTARQLLKLYKKVLEA